MVEEFFSPCKRRYTNCIRFLDLANANDQIQEPNTIINDQIQEPNTIINDQLQEPNTIINDQIQEPNNYLMILGSRINFGH